MAEPIRELAGLDRRALPDALLQGDEPVVLRGLVADWPVVRAARESSAACTKYLLRFHRKVPVVLMLGLPEIGGRFFYNEEITGFNFRREQALLDRVLEGLARLENEAKPPALYVGSTAIDECLPGFGAENAIELGARDPLASIWIGNRTRIAAHQDVPDNIACVVAGRRRFTLFPPAQLRNLYIGPVDLTPAGQPISLVDFANPDLEKHPRFSEAMAHARVAELEPGDAVFIPSLWWHHVESLEAYNVLVNYWWRQSPEYMDSPMNALLYAMLSVRDLPMAQREAWLEIFRHYIFENGEETAGHIPAPAQRILGELNPDLARGLRAYLLKRLNR